MNKEIKTCQNCKNQFTIEPEDFQFYEKIKVPPPTWCPDCRLRRRLVFRNTYFLYKRKSDYSGKIIFSAISDDSPVKVYSFEEWMSDNWDPLSYGRDINFSRPFFAQVHELFREVPWRAKSELNVVNSDYSNNCGNLRNCYLCFNADSNEDCSYSNGIKNVKTSLDISHVAQAENCYECFWLTKCTRAYFSSLCEDSYDIYFSKGLRGCHDCFMCSDLKNKQYCIFNNQYLKEEYKRRLAEFDLSSFNSLQKLRTQVKEFHLKFPWKFREGTKNVNVTGEYISNSKNVRNSYIIRGGEDARYSQYFQNSPFRDSYDCTSFGNGVERSYECMQIGWGTYDLIGCLQCWTEVKNLRYCANCMSTSSSFGCVGLRNKEYCILNKQYTREEYENLVPKIIVHMNEMPYVDKFGRKYAYGEFLPAEFSPYAYNQSIAQEHFPLSEEQATTRGYRWRNQQEREYVISVTAENLPDRIDAVPDEIVQSVIGCDHEEKCHHQCTLAFRILKSELSFYRLNHLALPRLCPNCRREERFVQKNHPFLTHRQCGCGGGQSENGKYINLGEHFHGLNHCPNEFETSYAPDRKEIVYCEQCYNAEVI